MKEYFSLDAEERRRVAEAIKKTLFEREDIVFAYLYGSFQDAPSFRDIDIGVYLKTARQSEAFDREIDFAQAIAKATGKPFDIIDVRILNFAPASFLNNILRRGTLLFSKNYQLLTDLVENASLEALANEHVAGQSLRELIPV